MHRIFGRVTAGAAAFLMGILGSSAFAGVNLPVPYMAQPDDQTCLPTSFMMALNWYGRLDGLTSDTVQELHKTCQYNRFNTPPLARKFGLYALPSWNSLGWTPDTVRRELDLGHPVVLGLNTGRYGHFVLAVGYTDDGDFIINNPSSIAWSPTQGGDHRKVSWKEMMVRGGIIIHPTPFQEGPELSGVAIEGTLPIEGAITRRLTAGDDTEVSFTLLNNGRAPWPEKMFLAPIDPDSSPTQTVKSPIESGWISSERVTGALPNLEPETTGVITFKVKAPDVEKTTTFMQYFQLVDGDGNWFGTNWLAGPGNRNMAVRLISDPKQEWKLPLAEGAEPGKINLPWAAKFGKVELVDNFTTAPPEKGTVARLLTPEQRWDSAWLGDPKGSDYRVEAWVYCDMRPKTTDTLGYERVGIFARDNGTHRGDTKEEEEIGFSLAMTFDSDDGSVRAGDVLNGVVGDYRDNRFKLKESGWQHFAINCQGTTISYELNGKPFHTETRVRAHPQGDFGVYYNAPPFPLSPQALEPRGVVFSGFKATEL